MFMVSFRGDIHRRTDRLLHVLFVLGTLDLIYLTEVLFKACPEIVLPKSVRSQFCVESTFKSECKTSGLFNSRQCVDEGMMLQGQEGGALGIIGHLTAILLTTLIPQTIHTSVLFTRITLKSKTTQEPGSRVRKARKALFSKVFFQILCIDRKWSHSSFSMLAEMSVFIGFRHDLESPPK